MADTYGVTSADIASEIPSLFPDGFSSASRPVKSLVEKWISTADVRVQLAIVIDAGTPPSTSDKASLLAVSYIKNRVLAQVMRVVYAGRQPQDVAAAVKPYVDAAADDLASLEALGTAAVGDGSADQSRVSGDMGNGSFADRALLVTDDQLDGRCPSRRW